MTLNKCRDTQIINFRFLLCFLTFFIWKYLKLDFKVIPWSNIISLKQTGCSNSIKASFSPKQGDLQTRGMTWTSLLSLWTHGRTWTTVSIQGSSTNVALFLSLNWLCSLFAAPSRLPGTCECPLAFLLSTSLSHVPSTHLIPLSSVPVTTTSSHSQLLLTIATSPYSI